MKPRTLSRGGLNGLALIRAIDWRTSALVGKALRRRCLCTSVWIGSEFVIPEGQIPQSVMVPRTISASNSRCEMVSERITRQSYKPPALRIHGSHPRSAREPAT